MLEYLEESEPDPTLQESYQRRTDRQAETDKPALNEDKDDVEEDSPLFDIAELVKLKGLSREE